MTGVEKTTSQEASDLAACRYIIDFIYDRCRIRLHDGKEALIRSRLGKRLRHHGFTSLGEYCDYLKKDANEEELTLLVDALTTNFTNFLREEAHFDFLVKTALPQLVGTKQKKFNVWSAACSTGEEPYTISFYLNEHFPVDSGWDWNITASDISTKVLAKALEGVYQADRLEPVPQEWLRKYFQKGVGKWEGHYRIKRWIADRVHFRNLNLIENYQHTQSFEVVFCRNVMIYFDRHTQQDLVNRICRHIVPGGYLLIGHSESLNGLDVPLRCIQPSIYRRKD
jgi:chemotaxis protein methyltransferase CheR